MNYTPCTAPLNIGEVLELQAVPVFVDYDKNAELTELRKAAELVLDDLTRFGLQITDADKSEDAAKMRHMLMDVITSGTADELRQVVEWHTANAAKLQLVVVPKHEQPKIDEYQKLSDIVRAPYKPREEVHRENMQRWCLRKKVNKQ